MSLGWGVLFERSNSTGWIHRLPLTNKKKWPREERSIGRTDFPNRLCPTNWNITVCSTFFLCWFQIFTCTELLEGTGYLIIIWTSPKFILLTYTRQLSMKMCYPPSSNKLNFLKLKVIIIIMLINRMASGQDYELWQRAYLVFFKFWLSDTPTHFLKWSHLSFIFSS